MADAPSPCDSPHAKHLNAIYEGLPPLNSPEYRAYLRTASCADLPAEIVVRAYRELRRSGNAEAADATLDRLLAHDDAYRYLAPVWYLAERRRWISDGAVDAEDLVQETVERIVRTLAGPRGAYAERAWVAYCKREFSEAWRAVYGRRSQKAAVELEEPRQDPETGDWNDPAEDTDGKAAPWHTHGGEGMEWLRSFINRSIARMRDPLMQAVAQDQFGEDPSTISGIGGENGKPPLTEQLGVTRFRIMRARDRARTQIRAELQVQNEYVHDAEWLDQWFPDDRDDLDPVNAAP